MSATHGDWPELFAAFERIADAPRDERARLLDEATRDRPELRSRLERLLALDASDADLGAQVSGWRERLVGGDATEPAPARIGAWQIIREIGSGGMGCVFLAERVDGEYEQTVALKVIRGEFTSDAAVARFLAERRILARLDHPGIAGLVDGGVDANGRPWFAMQYVEGDALPDYCSTHALGVEARLQLIIAVCEAVAYAHRQLVVHCDLKPSNVLVDANGNARLLDFGIARLLRAENPAPSATQTQTRALTPGYAAPEQLTGRPVGVATDVYALGVMLYELLVGTRPYARDGETPAEIAIAQAQGEPPSPSRAATPASPVSRRRLRGDLDLIATRALHHDPAGRYPGADALAEDLRRHLAGFPLRAMRDSAAHRTRKFIARHRIAVPLAALAIIALLATTLFALVQMRAARQQADRAEEVRSFLVGVFEQASPDENKGQPITTHQLLEKGERQIEKGGPGLRPELIADITALLGSLYIDVSDFDRAEALLVRAMDAAADPAVPDDVRVHAVLGMARIGNEKGEYDAALGHARHALAIAARLRPANAQAIADAHLAIAIALVGKHEWADAEAFLRDSLPRDRAALGENNDAVAEQSVQLGNTYAAIGRYADGEAAFRSAIAAYAAIYGDNSYHAAHTLNELSNMLQDSGDVAGAETALRQALAIRLATVGEHHRDTLIVRHNLLTVIEVEGRFVEALPQRLQLIEDARATGLLQPGDVYSLQVALGKDYRETGRFRDAESALTQAIAINAALPEDERDVLNGPALRNLGLTQMLNGEYANAEATFERVLAIRAKTEPPTSPNLGLAHTDLGNLRRLQHRPADALIELAAAADAFDTDAAVKNPWRPQAVAGLSEAQLDAGDADAAAQTGQRAVALAREALPPRYYQLGIPLFAAARAMLAQGRAGDAETLLREALAVRSPLFPADDPRMLEVKVALVVALTSLGRIDEAARLRGEIEAPLRSSPSPYFADLRARLAMH